MIKYDEFLINKLLDSYESSALYNESNKNNQRIYFSFNKKNIPDYFNEESTVYEEINRLVMDLKYKGFIDILWKNKREGHIIEKIVLNIEQLEKAYTYAKRKQKKVFEEKILELLKRYTSKEKTLDAFITYLIERINGNKSVKKYFELGDLTYIEKLLIGIYAIVTNKEEVYIRELSIKLFKDSKFFEILEGKVMNIILEFHPSKKELEGVEDLFSEFNVIKNPSFLMLKGIGSIKVNHSIINLSDFENGIGINSKDLNSIEFLPYEEVKKLVTIENLTTFNRYKDSQAVIIYLGGYHNEVRRELLKKLYKVYPAIDFYHWGDIDCGGFRIMNHLAEKTGIPFVPMNMDEEVLLKYMDYTKPLTQLDKDILTKMKDDDRFRTFGGVVRLMLEKGVKLEQEIVSFEMGLQN
jgi:hypothetical protein